MNLHFAFRDEVVNIHSMSKGGLPNRYSHQILVCKKKPIIRYGPFLLDPKKTKSPRYNLSKVGQWYHDKVSREDFTFKYVAFIDSQIQIKINGSIFSELAENGFFSVWEPSAPVDFFVKKVTGYLSVFRVYEINSEIDVSLLDKGRAGKNFYYGLTEDQHIEIRQPVIGDAEFASMIQELQSLLKKNDVYIDTHKPLRLKLTPLSAIG